MSSVNIVEPCKTCVPPTVFFFFFFFMLNNVKSLKDSPLASMEASLCRREAGKRKEVKCLMT